MATEQHRYTEELKGRVFKIESLNTHNGPGYRTVIYMKGCTLNCLWCHNPEGISQKKEIWVLHSKCIGCLCCVSVCPHSALSFVQDKIEVDRDKCTGCYTCAGFCPTKAIEKLGEDFTVDEVFDKVLKDKVFMDTSGGGVTVTGGEPGMAPEFVSQLFRKCREEGIHTAFDTSGLISKKALDAIIPFTDLVFFDLKIMKEENAKKMTGKGTSQISESLNWIKSYKMEHDKPELQFRTPIIPGATDSKENLEAIEQLLRENYEGLFTDWELNLFNDICEDKYQRINREWIFREKEFGAGAYQEIEAFKNKNQKFNITISGFIQKS